MKLGPIDASRIEAMASRLQAAAARPAQTDFSSTLATSPTTAASGMTASAGIGQAGKSRSTHESTKVSFSESLKKMLDSVNNQQLKANGLSERFALGDDGVNLSDVMIERQKASLSLQATAQVRNKLVSAYHEIMNMQV